MIFKPSAVFVLAAVATFTICPPGPARAQTPDPRSTGTLTLMAAVQRALDTYPAVRQAEANYSAAEAGKRASRAEYFPTLQLSGTLTRFEKPMVVTPIHGFTPGQLPAFDRTLIQGAVRMGFLVFDGFGRRARFRQSSAELRAADVARSSAEQALIAQTVTAYLAVQSAREIAGAHRRRVEAFEAERERVRQLTQVGRAADVELLRIEAALAAARADLVNFEEMADLALRDLARVSGMAPDSLSGAEFLPVRLIDSTEHRRDDLMQQARISNPELKRAHWQTAAAAAARAAARGVRWPQLKAAASYQSFDSPDVTGVYEWNAGLELTFPVFTGGAISAAIARATAAHRAATEAERRAELDVGRAVDMALSAGRQARARAASLARAVDGYVEVARIEKLLLESGAGTQTDYLDAQADLLTAQAGLAEARHKVMAAEVETARVTGILSPRWLEEKLEQTQ